MVRDTKYTNLRRDIQPPLFIASRGEDVSFEIRTGRDPSHLVPGVRAILGRLAPKLALIDPKTQTQEIERLLFGEKLMARMASLFAGLALLLACIGLYA